MTPAHAVILAGGDASRLGGAFKPLVPIGGRNVIDWQLDRLDGIPVTVEGQPVNHGLFAALYPWIGWVPAVPGGPVAGLLNVLDRLDVPDLLVAYSDSIWFDPMPYAPAWVGVAWAAGGRAWDVVNGSCTYGRWDVPVGMSTQVCVGVYRFSNTDALRVACRQVLDDTDGEAHMWDVCSRLYMPAHSLDWLDVGDRAALATAEARLVA